MIKIPYIKIKQRAEVFFAVKLSASFLKEHVDFHFRDPYRKHKNIEEVEKTDDYLKKINKLGIDLKSSSEGVQRRLQEARIHEIKQYVEDNTSNFFPGSIIVSVDTKNIVDFEEQYMTYEQNDAGFLKLPDDVVFKIIDGQHRLAGLFICEEEIIKEFEFAAILLFDVSLSTAAKLFSDINGKQKAVNRSLIYDLYEEVKAPEIEEIKRFHALAQTFYIDKNSPLFRQIKMLGVGHGAISQAFFIDYVMSAIKETDLIKKSTQKIYDQLFYYFRSFQKVFPEDWPVPIHFESLEDVDNYSEKVLKERKSQLCKTNGFGAILNLFPEIYKQTDGNNVDYLRMIFKLKEKISWVAKEGDITGTGKKFQSVLENKMRNAIFH